MTNTENEPPLLKTDTLDCVFTPPARREQLLDGFERSGLSGAKFAALAGIKVSVKRGNCSGRFRTVRQEGAAIESEAEVFEDGQAVFAEG